MSQNANTIDTSMPHLEIYQEQESRTILATESEIKAMDSERVQDILGFSDENIRLMRQNDLGTKILSNRDAAQFMVPVANLRIYKGLNPRLPSTEWDAHIEYLAGVMMEQGFWSHKPIYGFVAKAGKNNVIYIADGESRYRAAQIAIERGADISEIPVRLAPEGTSIEQIMLQLAPSNKGREFTPLEKALLAQRQLASGRTVAQVADNLSCSTEYAHQLLALAAAPTKVRDMVRAGLVPASMAIEVVRDQSIENPVVTLETAVENAKAAGKTKASGKHLPQQAKISAFKKHSGTMHEVISRLQESEMYVLLPDDIKERIDGLLKAIDKDSKPKVAKKAKGKSAGQDAGEGANEGAIEGAIEGAQEPEDALQAALVE